MNTGYSNIDRDTVISVTLFHGNPMGMDPRQLETELRLRNRGKNRPNNGRQRKPGDVYIVISIIVGAAIGGLLAGLFSSLAIFGGIIAGGILGAVIYNTIKKRPQKRKTKQEEPPQSPFIS